MCQTQTIGNFTAEKQKNGTFLYKAKDPSQTIPTVKLKDRPQFKVINTMEDEMKKSGKKMIEKIGIDLIKLLNKK